MRYTALFFMLTILLVPALPAYAQVTVADPLVVDLAEDHVDITTGFDGEHLVLFGVREKRGEIAIVIQGPKRSAVVRKKQQVLGAWMNRHAVEFKDVFSFYDYALSVPEDQLLRHADLKKNDIGTPAFLFRSDETDQEKIKDFQTALVRNKQAQGLYPLAPKEITFLNESLFRSEFYIPANVTPGDYTIHTFLIRNKKVLEEDVTQLRVAQVGTSAMLYKLAFDQSFLYALLCLMVALVAGFGVHWLRR